MISTGVAGLSEAPAFFPQRLHQLDRSMEMRASLRVDRDDVSSSLGKLRNIGIDRRNHQMDIKG